MRYRGRKGLALFLGLSLAFHLSASGSVSEAAGVAKPTVTVVKRTKKTATIKISVKGKITSCRIYLKEGKNGKYKLSFAMQKGNVTLKKLKPRETYYVKVRAYRYLKSSSYSKVKKIEPYEKAEISVPAEVPVPSEIPGASPSAPPDASEAPETSETPESSGMPEA